MVKRDDMTKAMVNDNYPYMIEKYEMSRSKLLDVVEVIKGTGEYEQETSALGPGELRQVAEGATIPQVSTQEGYTSYCAPRKFGERIKISREAVEDNRKVKPFLKKWTEGWGESHAQTIGIRLARMFTNGGFTAGDDVFTNSSPTNTPSYGAFVYDTFPLFNRSNNLRTTKNTGTYYNGIITLGFNSGNLQTLVQLMTVTNAYNEAGLRMNIEPNVLICQKNSNVKYAAERLFKAQGDVDNSGGAAGTYNTWQGKFEVVDDRFITDDDMWIIGMKKKGITFVDRIPPEFDYYEDEDNDGYIGKTRARWWFWVHNWRYWAAANFATS